MAESLEDYLETQMLVLHQDMYWPGTIFQVESKSESIGVMSTLAMV